MRKSFMAMFLCFAAALPMLSAEITKDGKPVAEIIIPERESAPLTVAAQELQLLIKEISGAELAVFIEKGKSTGTRIFLGSDFAKNFTEDLKFLDGSDGYAIRSKGNDIYVFGASDRGTLRGIYALLHENTDLIFARPVDGIVCSENKNLVFNNLNSIVRPAWDSFNYGLVSEHFNPLTHLWSMRNGANERGMFYSKYHIYSTLTMFFRSEIGYELGGLLPNESYFNTNPDFFSFKQGSRQPYKHFGPQLCYSNMQGADKVAENALAKLDQDLTPAIRKVHFGFGDTWDLCTCEKCMAPIKLADGTEVKYGDEAHRSTQYYIYLNRIAEKIHAKYPNLEINTLGYLYAAIPPKIKLNPAITVTFCPYVKNDKVPVTDPCNSQWEKRSRDWASVSPNIGIFEYYGDSSDFMRPIADTAEKDLRFWNSLGIRKYISLETYPDSINNLNLKHAWDVSAVEYWVLSRLFMNPGLNAADLRKEYFSRAYREAAPAIEKFYSLFHKSWYSDAFPAYWNDVAINSANYYIRKKGIEKPMRDALEEAERLAVHPVSKRLVANLKDTFEYWMTEAKKIPDTVTVDVPYSADAKKAASDFESPLWAKGGRISDFEQAGKPGTKTPSESQSQVFLLHDRSNLYVKWVKKTPKIAEMRTEKLPKVGRDKLWSTAEADSQMTFELFIAPPARDKYFQLAVNQHALIYDAQGYDSKVDTRMTADVRKTAEAIEVIYSIPLEDLGVNVNTGNRLGALFYCEGSSWMGGNVHAMAAFNDLYLKME